MYNELTCVLALRMIKGIGDTVLGQLLRTFGTAQAVFNQSAFELTQCNRIQPTLARRIKQFNNWSEAELQAQKIQDNDLHWCCISQPNYPSKLKVCKDAPPLLFSKGNMHWQRAHTLAIVGTRASTRYGKEVTQQLIQGLAAHPVLIVSGLAHGIDAYAHKAALAFGLPTVGVVAHGLDSIYPVEHTQLAQHMQVQGAIISECIPGTPADKENFPKRNRIIAGLADAVLVVEAGATGGALITATCAQSYHRPVLAVPGRINDMASLGCNRLIELGVAQAVTSSDTILQHLQWDKIPTQKPMQTQLMLDLETDEQIVYDLLREVGTVHIDTLQQHSGLSMSTLSALLLVLEMKGIVKSLPGKQFSAD